MQIIRALFILSFLLLCWGTLFLTISFFINKQTTPKEFSFIFFSAAILIVFIFSSIRRYKIKKWMNNLIFSFGLIITILCFVQALYGIMQYVHIFSAYERFKLTGSFDNPAGFAASLCAGFPFFFYFLSIKKYKICYASLCGIMTVGLAILLSGSRTGILTMAIVCVSMFFYKLSIKKMYKIIVTGFLAALIIGLYFVNKDSANGRLLIWQCSWEMIKDRPFMGHGPDGFRAGYMDYQARYFEKYPNSKYVMLADNTNRPFNEYIELLVNYGLFGLSLFLLIVYLLIRVYKRNMHKKPQFTLYIACQCLIAIAVFAFFSYPFRYPFVWVIGLLSCSIILFQRNEYIYILLPRRYCLSVLLIVFVLAIFGKNYNRFLAEIKWSMIARKSMLGQTEEMLPEYRLLYSKMHNNVSFLYNYAAELNFAKHYEESLLIASECKVFWADYDLQLLMADNYLQLKNYTQAERYYLKAAAMCPAKFMPLYKLFQLYKITDKKAHTHRIAITITNKPVKVMSPTVSRIKNEVKQELSRL